MCIRCWGMFVACARQYVEERTSFVGVFHLVLMLRTTDLFIEIYGGNFLITHTIPLNAIIFSLRHVQAAPSTMSR